MTSGGAGGLALIQHSATAHFEGMPRSALGADHVLAPADMPAILMHHRPPPYVTSPNFLVAAESAGKPPRFAQQDVLRDPPFARIDLVCCRNMLIYIELEAQACARHLPSRNQRRRRPVPWQC